MIFGTPSELLYFSGTFLFDILKFHFQYFKLLFFSFFCTSLLNFIFLSFIEFLTYFPCLFLLEFILEFIFVLLDFFEHIYNNSFVSFVWGFILFTRIKLLILGGCCIELVYQISVVCIGIYASRAIYLFIYFNWRHPYSFDAYIHNVQDGPGIGLNCHFLF